MARGIVEVRLLPSLATTLMNVAAPCSTNVILTHVSFLRHYFFSTNNNSLAGDPEVKSGLYLPAYYLSWCLSVFVSFFLHGSLFRVDGVLCWNPSLCWLLKSRNPVFHWLMAFSRARLRDTITVCNWYSLDVFEMATCIRMRELMGVICVRVKHLVRLCSRPLYRHKRIPQ